MPLSATRRLLISGFLAASVIGGCRHADAVDPHDSMTKTHEIGGLLSITGNWSTLGVTGDEAARAAVQDVNAWAAQRGSNETITWRLYDTKLDPATAKAYLVAAAASGLHVVVGPQSSAEVSALRQTADSLNVLVISPSSTAGSLAIAGDNILRLCPSDKQEGPAIASMMRAEGKSVVLAVWRDDIGNRGLATSVRENMTANGGAVVGGFEYSTTTTDFAPIVAQLRTELDIAVKIYGKEKVAVYVPAFDEVVNLAAAIPADDTLLRGVRWYGGDGTVNSTALAPQVAFFEQVGYPCPDVGIGDAIERAKPIIDRIQTATGIVPDAFALCVYDAVWLAGMSMLSGSHSGGGSVLRQRVTDAASVYYGASGWTKLNDAGDRAYGVYDMKVLRRVNGTPTWVTVGTWDAIKGYKRQ